MSMRIAQLLRLCMKRPSRERRQGSPVRGVTRLFLERRRCVRRGTRRSKHCIEGWQILAKTASADLLGSDMLRYVCSRRESRVWSMPKALLIDLRVHVLFRMADGLDVEESEIIAVAIREFIAAGSTTHFETSHFSRRFDAEPSVPLSADVDPCVLADLTGLVLAHIDAGEPAGASHLVAVALDAYLSSSGRDVLRATWSLSEDASLSLIEHCQRWQCSPVDVLNRLLCSEVPPDRATRF